METIINLLQSLVPENFDIETVLKAVLLLCVGTLLIGFVGRLIFGKKSVLNQSVSSAIGILFIYALTIAVYSYGIDLDYLISPLPFISMSGEYLHIFSFAGSDYISVCGQLLNMVILAFLVNLANSWLPKGKHILSWLIFRCLSIILAMLLHAAATYLLSMWLPEGLLTWAPVILLGLLVLMLAVGALKFVVGAVLTTVSPVIAIIYTFFFSTVIGKQISKAVLTTLIISSLVFGLNHIGCSVVYIGAAALAAYLPFLIILLVIWYVVGKLL